MSNIKSKNRCLGTYQIIKDKNVMITHNASRKRCICSSDRTRSDIIGPNLKSYNHCRSKNFFYLQKKTGFDGKFKAKLNTLNV